MSAPARPHFATFTLTRDYKAAPARVFAAFTDKSAKERWFTAGEGFSTLSYALDARPHGWEIWRGQFEGGPEIVNNTVYLELIEPRRITCAYEMFIGGERLSSSLLSVEIEPHGAGARLTLTEQGAYLGGEPDYQNRITGTRDLLEALAREVDG